MKFHPHGNVDFKQYDDIVFVRISHSLNLEMFELYNREMLSYEKGYNGRRWAQILDLREFELSPLDVMEAAQREERERSDYSTRCSHQVMVVNSTMLKQILEDKTSNPHMVKPEFCESIEEAFSILESKGYKGCDLYKREQP